MKKIFAIIGIVGLLGFGFEPAEADESGKMKYTITVTEFENKANYSGKWNLGNAFGTIMTDRLMESGRFVVIGETSMRKAAVDEQNMAAAGITKKGKKTPKSGQMTPAQLLVKGAITHVESATSGQSGGIGFGGFSIGGKKGSAEINVTIYLVDSQTGMVKASKSVVGKSQEKGLNLGISRFGFSGKLGGFKKDNMGKATESAIQKGIVFLIEQLDDIPWEGSIIIAKPEKIIINRGTREGVSMGQTFSVGSAEQIIDPDTGEVLDEDVTVVAKIEVTKVKEKIAYCKAVEGGDKIQRGMAIRLPGTM